MTGSDSVEGADDVITDDDVRSGYAEPSHGFGDEVERAYVEFDRWLLSHDLSVSAETLRETADWLDRATDPDCADWDPAIAGIEFDTDMLRRRADLLSPQEVGDPGSDVRFVVIGRDVRDQDTGRIMLGPSEPAAAVAARLLNAGADPGQWVWTHSLEDRSQ